MPNVTVTVTNMQTSVVVGTVKTDTSGNYEVPNVPSGNYRVKADITGFKPFVAENVYVDPKQIRRVDVQLQVASTSTDVVTVEGSAAVIATDNGTIGGLVDQKKYQDIPVVDFYPGALNVIATVPGVRDGAAGQATISGQNWSQISEGSDGINNDRNGQQYQNMNFAQDITVTTVNAPADSSRLGSFNLTSKRGANLFHFTAFYRYFSSALDANSFSNNRLGIRKTPYIQHDWQGEASGPIFKNKTFFYFGWFESRIPLGSFYTSSVPTPQMRAGDFSQFTKALIDPLTNQPFPNNAIPQTRLGLAASSVAQKTQQAYFPLPNLGAPGATVNNYGYAFPFNGDYYRGDWPYATIDHSFTQKNRISGHWTMRDSPYALSQNGLPAFTWTELRHHQQYAVDDTHVFSTKLVNLARWGYNHDYVFLGNETAGVTPLHGDQVVQAVGLQGVNPAGYSVQGSPTFSFSGNGSVTSLSDQSGGLATLNKDLTYGDAVTWIKGNHIFKFGADYNTFNGFSGTISTTNYGSFTFNGTFTGNAYADFMLGLPLSSSRLNPLTNRTTLNKEFGPYAEDTWKVTPHLTLDYGLRWDYYAIPTYADGLMYNFDPSTGNVIVPQNAIAKVSPLYPKTISIVAGDPEPHSKKTNIRPRVAVAYRLGDKTVIRGGYGQFTERFGTSYTERVNGAGPFQIAESYTNSIQNGQPFFSMPNPFPVSLASAAIPSQSVVALPVDTSNGVIHQFNLSVEREIHQVGVRVSYIGSRGLGLNYSFAANKPQPSTITWTQSRNPFPQVVGVTEYRTDGKTRYNSLQVEGKRRVGMVQFDAHYTWLNNMSNMLDNENPYALGQFWGKDNYSRRHEAVITSSWALPFGKGRRHLANAPGVIDAVLGGWNLITITYFGTGQYSTPSFSGSDPSHTNTSGGIPDRICNGNIDPSQRTYTHWFDASCFAVPPSGRFGNSGVNVIEGQGLNNTDLSVAKRFRITEKLSSTLTTAFEDIFNHATFGGLNLNISNPATVAQYTGVQGNYFIEKGFYRQISFKLRFEY